MAEDYVRQYEEKGYTVIRGVLDQALIEEARGHVDWLCEKNPGIRPENLDFFLVRDDPFWIRLVSDPRLLDVAEKFIGPNIALFSSHYISKPAFEGKPVLWHQDGSYWPLDPMDVVTLWLAVDSSTRENGCLRVIPGTQHMQLEAMEERTDVDNVLGSGLNDAKVDESKAVDLELNPGDVSIHHPNVVHGSKANNSPHRRCGLTIRYIPTSTRITKPDVGAPFLLRGEAVEGVNEYLPPPKFVPEKHFSFRGSQQYA